MMISCVLLESSCAAEAGGLSGLAAQVEALLFLPASLPTEERLNAEPSDSLPGSQEEAKHSDD